MSVSIKYKDNEIINLVESETKTLLTSGKYCSDDIIIENIRDNDGENVLWYNRLE